MLGDAAARGRLGFTLVQQSFHLLIGVRTASRRRGAGSCTAPDFRLQIIKLRTEDTIHQCLIVFHFLLSSLTTAAHADIPLAQQKTLTAGGKAGRAPALLSPGISCLLLEASQSQGQLPTACPQPLTPMPDPALLWPL